MILLQTVIFNRRFFIRSLYLCVLLPFFLLGCQSEQKSTKNGLTDIKSYYFPLDELSDGRVYEYRPLNNDSIGSYYWLYRTLKQDNEYFFLGQNYDADFTIQQMMTESIEEEGSFLKKFFYYYAANDAEKRTPIPIKIESPYVFPFSVQDSGKSYLYQIKYTEPENPEATTTLIRKRRYLGKSSYKYKGKELDCIKFGLREVVDNEEIGHLEFEFDGEEIYAKNIGLVYYKKNVSEGNVLEYGLVNIFTVKELEDKYKAILEDFQ